MNEIIKKGWVARDEDKGLWFFDIKPNKEYEYKRWFVECECCVKLDYELFPQVKWEDEEPTEVEMTITITNNKVLLTSEILLNNGFIEQSQHRFVHADCKKYCVVNEKNFDGTDNWYFCFNVTDDNKFGHMCLFECNYVYELQQILNFLKSDVELL